MSTTVNGNYAELYRVRFGATPPQATDPHILWADTTASPAVLKTYSGGAWVPVAGGSGQGGGVAQVAVTPPATNTGTPTAPIIGVAPATAQAAGSLAATDYGKLQAVEAGAQANVLEGVTGTAPITAGAVAGKQQAIGIVPASASVAGSMSAADKAKLDGMAAGAGVASVGVTAPATNTGTATAPNIGVQAASGSQPGSLAAADYTKLQGIAAGAQANLLEDVTVASTTTALTVTNGAAGGIVAKVKAVSLAVAVAVANGAAGLLSGADKAKLDATASGAQVNVLEGVTGTAPLVAGAVTAKSQALSIVPATASVPGSMAAADKAKLDGLVFDADGALLLHGAGAGLVGRKTRLAGPQEDAHLRAGDAAGSLAMVESGGDANLTANAYWDGVNWQRFDTGQPAARWRANPAALAASLETAAAGANPLTWATRAVLQYLGGAGYGQLQLQGAASQMVAGPGALQLLANAYWDGTNWQRYDTTKPSIMLRIGADTAAIEVLFSPAGSGVVAWPTQYTLANPNTLAVVARTPLPFAAGWASFAGFPCMFSRDALGYVHLEGLMSKGSAIVAGELAATLPSGVRPAATISVSGSGSSGMPVQLSIGTNGQINVSPHATYPSTYAGLSNVAPYIATN